MLGMLAILAVGFGLGIRHATDPDHVVAVATIVSRQRDTFRAAVTGAVWGIGHTLTIVLVGGLIIFFNLVVPPRLGLAMELVVAITLIVLGLANQTGWLRAMFATRRGNPRHDAGVVHSHAHSHGDYVHSHPHSLDPEVHPHPADRTPLASLDRWLGGLTLYQLSRPLVVGVVHGLAGSAAVTLLVLMAIPDSSWALSYLLVFGVGTIAGMMAITVGLASTFRFAGGTHERVTRRIGMAAGMVSVVFGLVLAYQVCVVDGLFSSHPRWTPH